MSAPVSYFDVVRQMKNAFNYRFRLVTHARQHGINPSADGRAFRTTRQLTGAQVAAAL